MNRFFLALSLLILLTGCTTTRNAEPLPAVNRVDIDQFSGKWYVMASTPSIFQGDPYNATQMIERADRGFQITYQYNANAPSGERKTTTSQMMIDNPGINTDWQIVHTWPVQTDVRVLYVEPDYSVAVLGNPNRSRVTILSRQPSIDPPLYSDLFLKLQNLGYDVGRIRRVPHR